MPPEAAVIELHPKLVDKWARRYIHLYKNQGAPIAKRWATEFLTTEQRDVMSERVKDILKNKKGPRK